MTEDQARRVVWLLAREGAAADAAVPWSADDRAWATRQALALVGEAATPEAFVTARTTLALERLLPRDPAGQRFLVRRWWHPAWALAALLLGLLGGVLVDQLGPPQHVNLLAPAVWALVAWNLTVYGAFLWPGARRSGWLQRLAANAGVATPDAAAPLHTWARLAAPLTAQRLALLLHLAAAGLALGLVAGLYARGLVLDYRIGWQSTFLGAPAVQALLDTLLAPAAALTGIPVADVAPLRLAPGQPASASAAPWIHLLAATLVLTVVLPRLALAALAASRARRLAHRFPLPLDLPGLRSLHPLMRPGAPRPLRLLWVAPPGLAPLRLLDAEVHEPHGSHEPLLLWRHAEGDALELRPLPVPLGGSSGKPAGAAPPQPGLWNALRAALWPRASPEQRAVQALQSEIDMVLRVSPHPPGAAAPPAWLSELGRPVVALVDADAAEPPQLPLRALHDGWLRDGALWQALRAALPDDDRLERLSQSWQAAQAAELSRDMAQLAEVMARAAGARVELPSPGLLARGDATAAAEAQARAHLVQQLQGDLHEALGPAQPAGDAVALQPTRHDPLPEGRAAVVGGVVSGALAGLKADLATGGLTMGAGALAGGVIGALGAAGAARGLNAARGSGASHLSWGDDTAAPLAQALLQGWLRLQRPQQAARGATVLDAALATEAAALQAAWRARPDTGAVAAAAAPVLERVLRRTLGGP